MLSFIADSEKKKQKTQLSKSNPAYEELFMKGIADQADAEVVSTPNPSKPVLIAEETAVSGSYVADVTIFDDLLNNSFKENSKIIADMKATVDAHDDRIQQVVNDRIVALEATMQKKLDDLLVSIMTFVGNGNTTIIESMKDGFVRQSSIAQFRPETHIMNWKQNKASTSSSALEQNDTTYDAAAKDMADDKEVGPAQKYGLDIFQPINSMEQLDLLNLHINEKDVTAFYVSIFWVEHFFSIFNMR